MSSASPLLPPVFLLSIQGPLMHIRALNAEADLIAGGVFGEVVRSVAWECRDEMLMKHVEVQPFAATRLPHGS